MTHIKNLRPTRALENSISPIEMQNQALPNLHYLCILGSNVYVFLHEEDRSLKSAKWEARALREKLVGFDGHTIYRVHIEDQKKVIRVKNLRIYEDITSKTTKSLPDLEGKPTFDGIQIPDEQGPSDESSGSEEERPKSRPPQKPKRTQAGRDAHRASEEENEPKITEKPAKSRAGRTLKLSPKKQEEVGSATHTLITKLTSLLEKYWEDGRVVAFLTSCKESNADDNSHEADSPEQDPLHILAAIIHKANAGNSSDFSSSSQFDVEKPETYERVMSGPHAQQWPHAIQEALEQLEKRTERGKWFQSKRLIQATGPSRESGCSK